MSRYTSRAFGLLSVFGLILAAGCGGGSGGGSTRMSVVVPSVAAGAGVAALTSTDDSGNSLVFDSVEVVLGEVEFDLEDGGDDCNASSSAGAGCEEVEIGPMLVSLSLDGSMTTMLTADLPPGLYEEVEFDIEKASSNDPDDTDFLAMHPEFDGISVRVLGTYNGNSFEFTSSVSAEQEIEFDPAFEVVEGVPANVTITVDVDSWFRDRSGDLVDPATAGEDGPNEDVVEDNIEDSFDAFEDDDRDGHDDGEASLR